MSANSVYLAYLVAAVLFILTLKGLSSPMTSRRGNMFGMIGMAIAVLTTLSLTHNVGLIVLAILVGGTVGSVVARRVEMTQMPEMVAAMHSLVGLAAVLVAMAAFNNPVAYGIALPGEMLHSSNRIELFIGTFVGAITFTGSIIAFLKLSARLSGKPLRFAGQHWLNLGLGISM
ncbi:MAG: NAD synthetase, partial [Gallionellales bacterium CG_4_9_14_0_8_um_filter_55_61]